VKEAEIRGTVEGEPGDALAGWARVRKQRHHARGTVRVRTEDGVVELEVPGSCLLGPIETVKGTWQELEPHPAAQLCLAEAPAPDERSAVSYTIVRGGDVIVARGFVLTEQLVTEDAGGLRAGARSRVTRLSAHFIGVGPDADDIVARLRREADEEKREKEAAEAKDAAAKGAATKGAATKGAAKGQTKGEAKGEAKVAANGTTTGEVNNTANDAAKRDAARRALREYRMSRRNALLGVAAGIAIAVAGVALTRSPVPLLVAAVALALPLVVDELVLPDLHPFGRRATTFPAVAAGTIYLIAAALVPTIGWAYVFDRGSASRAGQLVVGMVVVGGIAMLAAVLTRLLDGGRRRILARIAAAPPHPSPLTDNAWGATDGVVEVPRTGAFHFDGLKVAAAVGHSSTSQGSGKQMTTFTSKLQGAALAMTVTGTPVRTADGWWLSLDYLDESTGERTARRAELIRDGAAVRVVGRAKSGTLAAGGPYTLLVFAAPAGSDVTGALAALRSRLQTNSVLALVGVAAFTALAIYGTSL
jgi:hypothetical protein